MPKRKSAAGKAVPRKADCPSGTFSYEGLDRVLHEKARLSIMSSLFTHPEGLLFNDLKGFCALTDGNLSRHLQILNEAGQDGCAWKKLLGNVENARDHFKRGNRDVVFR